MPLSRGVDVPCPQAQPRRCAVHQLPKSVERLLRARWLDTPSRSHAHSACALACRQGKAHRRAGPPAGAPQPSPQVQVELRLPQLRHQRLGCLQQRKAVAATTQVGGDGHVAHVRPVLRASAARQGKGL